MSIHAHSFFFPQRLFTCFTTFCLFVGIHFYKVSGPGVLSLATGLVARIQHSHCCSLTSISGQEPKSCFKPLQAEATWDQYHRAHFLSLCIWDPRKKAAIYKPDSRRNQMGQHFNFRLPTYRTVRNKFLDQSWVFFGRNDAKAETPVLWPPHVKSWLIGKDSDAGTDWGQEEKGTTEDEMAGWPHQLDRREFEWTPGVDDGQGGLACCNSWGCKELDTTERLNWNEAELI